MASRPWIRLSSRRFRKRLAQGVVRAQDLDSITSISENPASARYAIQARRGRPFLLGDHAIRGAGDTGQIISSPDGSRD